MEWKKNKFMAVLSIMLATSLLASSMAKAADQAPGEGVYLGAFMGLGMGILQANVDSAANTDAISNRSRAANSYETDRGGLGLSGIQGGGWLGWGMKTADDIYFGAEITALASDETIRLTTTDAIKGAGETEDTQADITEIEAQRLWSAGGSLRIGYYVNADTLFSVKGGVAVSAFDVDIGSSNETYLAGGPQVGGSVETRLSKVDPNLSLRVEMVYTNYLTADILGQAGVGRTAGSTGFDAELTGHDMAGRFGIQYSF